MGSQMMSGNLKQKEWVGYEDKDIFIILNFLIPGF